MRKVVYLGLDAHVRSCVLAGMDSRGKLLFNERFSTSESALKSQLVAVRRCGQGNTTAIRQLRKCLGTTGYLQLPACVNKVEDRAHTPGDGCAGLQARIR